MNKYFFEELVRVDVGLGKNSSLRFVVKFLGKLNYQLCLLVNYQLSLTPASKLYLGTATICNWSNKIWPTKVEANIMEQVSYLRYIFESIIPNLNHLQSH